jgi:HEPN domain-containing protein
LDYEKQVSYWRDGARESLRSVPVLEDGEFWVEALFWTHLAVEKALKAHVVKATNDVPPYIHNLPRLAETAGLHLSDDQLRLCDSLTRHQRLARYPYQAVREPDGDTSRRLLREAKEFLEWLLTRL